MTRLILETIQGGEAPLVAIYPEGAARLPVVVFCHGMGGDKRAGIEFGYRLASRGIFFVAPDAPGHGERPDARIAQAFGPEGAKAYPWETGLDTWRLMLEIVVELSREVEDLLDGWRDDPRLDVTRVGVSGLSMGGYWALYMAAHSGRVSAAAPAIALPDWSGRWADVTLEAASYGKWREAMAAAAPVTAEWSDWVAGLDPLPRLRRKAPQPLLMLCGDEDLAQPKSYSVKAYRELLPLYTQHPDRLRLSIYDGVGHRFNGDMQDEATEWFARWLIGD